MNENHKALSPRDPVTVLPGVGRARAAKLEKLEIKTIEDLLRHYPGRYEDRRRPTAVSALVDGVPALVRVRALNIMKPPPYTQRSASHIPMKVLCHDGEAELTLLFFNSRWVLDAFKADTEYWVYGTPRINASGITMSHPEFDIIRSDGSCGDSGYPNGTGIVPVYPLTGGITQKYLRGLTRMALPIAELAEEFLPAEIVAVRKLAPPGYVLSQIHFPADEHALNASRYRLVYEELFLLQARLLYSRSRFHTDAAFEGKSTCREEISAAEAFSLFPFELTCAQKRVIGEIRSDMANTRPMRRLLQGDVGSGKTAVAAAAAFFAAKSGYQTAIMAPTEILATQHMTEFENLFGGTDIQIRLLTSGVSPADKRDIKTGLQAGSIAIIIGTHALIEPDVIFNRLGLVVTDEQHRFGVRQRRKLFEKGVVHAGGAQGAPDTLVMSATPIPRTLALMLYADLDISVLDEMPPGRKAVTTRFIDSFKRDAAYDFAEREMASGRQIYIVTPMIGDEDVQDSDQNLQYPKLRTTLELQIELKARFPRRRIASLHGRMKSEEKEAIMQSFAAGEIDMLVSTVVIEVGVNVPNATMMLVENAERFGLAQLHQLRGRVGRGAAKSYCVLISDSSSELAVKRCKTLMKESDGFKIAELDFALRGPGDIFGVRQHGLPELKIADPAKHMDILRKANRDARTALENLEEHGSLRLLLEREYIE